MVVSIFNIYLIKRVKFNLLKWVKDRKCKDDGKFINGKCFVVCFLEIK